MYNHTFKYYCLPQMYNNEHYHCELCYSFISIFLHKYVNPLTYSFQLY